MEFVYFNEMMETVHWAMFHNALSMVLVGLLIGFFLGINAKRGR